MKPLIRMVPPSIRILVFRIRTARLSLIRNRTGFVYRGAAYRGDKGIEGRHTSGGLEHQQNENHWISYRPVVNIPVTMNGAAGTVHRDTVIYRAVPLPENFSIHEKPFLPTPNPSLATAFGA